MRSHGCAWTTGTEFIINPRARQCIGIAEVFLPIERHAGDIQPTSGSRRMEGNWPKVAQE